MTLIAAFAVLLVLLVVGALPTPLVAQTDDCASIYPTPGADRDNCNRTATAKAGQAYPNPSATSGGGGPPAPAATATVTGTATLTPTSTLRPATPTPGPTNTATATRQPQGSPTPTLTSTLVGLETILCVPGATVAIRGQAEPGLALLAYFADRPVGGALVRPDGSYYILLSIGEERPGLYAVNIRRRDSRTLVRELACEIPAATPTPTLPIVP